FRSATTRKGTAHAPGPADHPDSSACRRFAALALQRRLGLLPWQRLGTGVGDRLGFGPDGTDIAIVPALVMPVLRAGDLRMSPCYDAVCEYRHRNQLAATVLRGPAGNFA